MIVLSKKAGILYILEIKNILQQSLRVKLSTGILMILINTALEVKNNLSVEKINNKK